MNHLPTMVIIDFETNGALGADGKLDMANQQPTEVVAIRVTEGEAMSVFNTLIYYDGEWTKYLQSPSNKHTQEELRKGMPEEMVAEILRCMIIDPKKENHPIIVAYNALFDLEILYRLFTRTHLTGAPYFEDEFKEHVDFIDPLTIARDRHPYPHKLGDICRLYGIELAEAHLAMDDGMALVELVQKMHHDPKHPKGIMEYLNVAGWKRQYGEPAWFPAKATLKAQGNESYFHKSDGQAQKRSSIPIAGTPKPKPLPRLVPKRR